MGVGYTRFAEAVRADEILQKLKEHPNYSKQIPLENETQIDFALRVAAHLISPPQENDESTHIECIDLAAAIQALAPELNKIWNDHKSSQQNKEQ